MDEPLDEQYLKWLYHQVASTRQKNPARTYWSLLRHLFIKEYIWLIPNDDNRVEDGRDLRYEFIKECNVDPDREWLGIGCSVLEMLIGLSRRLAFESDGESRDWFWALLDNLDLHRFNDRYYDIHKENKSRKVIDEVIDQVVWRNYREDGSGGLFPLKHPRNDQRDVELWYQMSAYLLERG
jgi:hypothetical protein